MSNFENYRLKRKAYLDEHLKRGRLKDYYQDEETKADPGHGRKLIKKLRDIHGIEERIPCDVEFDDLFGDLFSDDPGGVALYDEYLDQLSVMVDIAARETAERRAALELLMSEFFNEYYKPEVDLELRRNITGAYLEYDYSVELKCRKLSYIRTACLYYGIWLVKDIPVDRIIAEKIKEVLGSECDVYDDKMLLRRIPDVNLSMDEESVSEILGQEEEDKWTDMESILAGTEEVRSYILAHPQQIDAQCLMSVVTGTEGLGRMSKKAAAFDEAIDRYTVTEECRNLDRPSWRRIFNGWVMVKAFSYVTERIISFVNEYRDKTVGEATDALEKMLPYISYAMVERNVRIVLRQMILEGRVYEFKLSDVLISDTLRKAAGKMRCICFAEAKADTMQELLKTIKNDKRPSPLPDQLHIKNLLEENSFICLKGDTIFGAIFVSETENSLVLNLAYTVDEYALASLVVSAYDEAVRLCGPDKHITIPVLSDRSAEVIENLVPKATRHRLVTVQQK